VNPEPPSQEHYRDEYKLVFEGYKFFCEYSFHYGCLWHEHTIGIASNLQSSRKGKSPQRIRYFQCGDVICVGSAHCGATDNFSISQFVETRY